ncbi:evolutionarily conserved signaling intermediate in Toll pathway, mitochondrial-like [Halichondria panicea]|uniref:evolutionarily conserved signaling intermediate in Toll pathway, mitochondrial-like n=1 Tax=Halichondria panicea TaxID=6063 RepID=UPI00312B6A14
MSLGPLYTRLHSCLQLRNHIIRCIPSYSRCYSSENPPHTQGKQSEELQAQDTVMKSHSLESTLSNKVRINQREQFSLAIDKFKKREKYSKGHMELIQVAMTQMEKLDLQKDIDVYNKIISIFPIGRFAPKRMLDAIWPRSIPQLELSLEILTKMEENGVRPNQETYNLLNHIFGKMSLPVQKCIRIAYLFDKYEYVDPYKVYVGSLPTEPVELSQFILKRLTSHRGNITVHKDKPDSYIVSATTERQVSLLHSDMSDALLHVEGPHTLWQHSLEQLYYTLTLTGSTHLTLLPEDQVEVAKKEGSVLSVCMCCPGNQERLEEWMDMMLSLYPSLTQARVVYHIQEMEADKEVKRISPTRTDLLEV